MSKPVILIDGSSYLYRAFHALPPLTNSHGEPTGAMYGVINMIKRLLQDYPAEHVGVIFDAKGKNFRHELYADYKAHRPPMPPELISQIQPLRDIITALGLPILSIPNVEADDVIGTLAKQAEQHGLSILISTGDKDMAQLVDGNIHLINTMNNQYLNSDGVKEKFGVTPEQIIDYLALVGDTSDNVPGVPKCGPKTAVKWLQEYGTLDNLLANAEHISGKIGENLRASITTLPLSRQLVSIKLDVDLPMTPEQLTLSPPNVVKLAELYQRYEFKTWLKELNQTTVELSPPNTPTATAYRVILTEAELTDYLQRLAQAQLFAFDIETTSLNYIDAELVGVSFAIHPQEAVYIPCGHDYMGAPTQIDRSTLLAALKPLLENPHLKKIMQHGKYDNNVLNNYGIKINGLQFDTMLESYVLNSTASRHDMSSLANKYLNKTVVEFETIAGKGKKQLTFNQIDIDTASQYAAEDADITLQLHQHCWPLLQADKKLASIFTDIEMPLVPILSAIECKGVLIDAKRLYTLSQEFAERMAILEEKTFALVGKPFNMDSPKQLQEILFNELGLPIIKKTPTGQPSTAEPILQELASDYEIPALIIEYRTAAKLKSTYSDKLPQLINAKTRRVHTSYHQALTSTGRLSSSDPNLQNIPIRTESGRNIRQAFIAAPGYQLLAADYSQIELRIMAHLSEDKNLLKAFIHGLDIHQATAAEVMGIAIDQVTPEQRRNAKAINFGLIYGMSAFGLAKQLKVSRTAAQDYIDVYFARYPGVKKYMDNTRQLAHDKGYVETLLGRRLYLPGIHDRNKMLQQAAERTAINAPMQGTAADIIKIAMIHVNAELANAKLDAAMIMQVHDELVFEIAEQDVTAAKKVIEQAMVNALKLTVPLEVGIGVGNNWDAAH